MLTSDYLPHKIYAGTYIILALLLQHLLTGWSILKSMGIFLWLYWTLDQDVILIQHTWHIMVESIAIYLYSLPLRGFAGDFREIFADKGGLGFLWLTRGCGCSGTYRWMSAKDVSTEIFAQSRYSNFSLKGFLHSSVLGWFPGRSAV